MEEDNEQCGPKKSGSLIQFILIFAVGLLVLMNYFQVKRVMDSIAASSMRMNQLQEEVVKTRQIIQTQLRQLMKETPAKPAESTE